MLTLFGLSFESAIILLKEVDSFNVVYIISCSRSVEWTWTQAIHSLMQPKAHVYWLQQQTKVRNHRDRL